MHDLRLGRLLDNDLRLLLDNDLRLLLDNDLRLHLLDLHRLWHHLLHDHGLLLNVHGRQLKDSRDAACARGASISAFLLVHVR